MSDEPSPVVALADSVSDLMNGVAGWILVAFGTLGLLSTGGSVVQLFDAAAPSPHPLVLVLLTLFSLCFVAAGVFVNPRFRRRLNRRHDPSRFGSVRSVDNRVVRADENCRERCVVCGSRVDEGLDRRFRSEYVVAGVPVYTTAEDHNYYCLSCATTELLDPDSERDGEPAVDSADRHAQGDRSTAVER
jgi:hypothetical protein